MRKRVSWIVRLGLQGWPIDFRLLGTSQALISMILHAESQPSKYILGIEQEPHQPHFYYSVLQL